jgi:hypothetical protein
VRGLIAFAFGRRSRLAGLRFNYCFSLICFFAASENCPLQSSLPSDDLLKASASAF